MSEESAQSEVSEVVESVAEVDNVEVDSAEGSEGVPSEEGVEVADGDVEETDAVEEQELGKGEEQLYEVMVDGQALKVSLSDMMKGFQLGTGAHKRFQEAARIQKEAKALQDSLSTDPIAAAIKAGASPAALRELMERYLYDHIKYDEMTPEQKELQDLRNFKKEQEQELNSRKQQELTVKQQQEQEHYQNTLIAAYDAALVKAGIPKTEHSVQRIAQIQLEALQDGWDIPMDLAVDQYQKEQQSLVDSYLQKLDESQIEQVIGKDRMKALRKKELAKLKNPTPSNRPQSTKSPQKEERMSASEFFDSLR